MSSRISSREETGDLQAWLDGDHALDDVPEGMPEAAIDPCWRSNMLIQVLLRGGQASPTHTFVYLDRYGGNIFIFNILAAIQTTDGHLHSSRCMGV